MGGLWMLNDILQNIFTIFLHQLQQEAPAGITASIAKHLVAAIGVQPSSSRRYSIEAQLAF